MVSHASAQAPGSRPQVPESPQDLDRAIGVGKRMLAHGNYPLAENTFRSLLLRHPESARITMLLGVCLQKQKRYDLAKETFLKALDMKGDFPERGATWHFLGWANYYLGKPDEARAAFLEHLKHDPEEGDSLFGLGVIALEQSQLDEAEKYLNEAIRVQTDKPTRQADLAKAHARLGQVYELRDDLARAEQELRLATTMMADLYEAWFMLERVYLRLERQADADKAHAEGEAARQRLRPQAPPGDSATTAPAQTAPATSTPQTQPTSQP